MAERTDLIIETKEQGKILSDLSLSDKYPKCPVVIFCHGFKGFKDWGQFNLMPQPFVQEGIHFLKFNFSHNGIGISGADDFSDLEAFSKNTYSKEVSDILEVVDWLYGDKNTYSNRMDLENICLMGHSRGGAMAILAASQENRLKKLITWSAVGNLEKRFPSKKELATWKEKGLMHIRNSRTHQEMPIRYDFYQDFVDNKKTLNVHEAESRLSIPHLLIHGTSDETVYLGEALQLMSLNEYTSLIKIHGATHTYGGYHPYFNKELPLHTEMAVKHSISFLQNG
ncbi:MAG: prolyl oligopeptidase family serine peptidase [Vicingaceae bacterium]